MCRVFVLYSQPIRFARFDGKSVNRGLPVLNKARALDLCRRSVVALGTRMDCTCTMNQMGGGYFLCYFKMVAQRLLKELSCQGERSSGNEIMKFYLVAGCHEHNCHVPHTLFDRHVLLTRMERLANIWVTVSHMSRCYSRTSSFALSFGAGFHKSFVLFWSVFVERLNDD